MTPKLRWGYTGIAVSVAIGLAVWLAKTVGFIEAWDGFLYDNILSLKVRLADRPPEVLLICLKHGETLSSSDGRKLLDGLRGMNPARIAFNFLPQHAGPEFYAQAASMSNLVFGRELIPSRLDPDILELAPLPEAAGGASLVWGVSQVPVGLHGLFRSQNAYVIQATNRWPALELVAASPARKQLDYYAENPDFLVDFIGPPGHMPNLTLAQSLAGDLLPELVRGRTVLIGYGHEGGLPGLYTPVSLGGQMMSLMEFQANAIQTLASGRQLRELNSVLLLVLLVALAFASAVVYQRVNAITALRITIELVVAFGLGVLITLLFLGIWIPLSALLTAQSFQFMALLILKTRLASGAIHELRLRSLARLKERLCPEAFYFSSEHWDHLASMVNQTLDIDRMVFLDRVERTSELRVAKVFGCNPDDIQVPKLSTQESPFAEAIETRTPIRVFEFLKPAEADENQYLCPLIFAGQMIGFWIIAIHPSRALAVPQFDTVLVEFSHQMAQLLYHKKKSISSDGQRSSLKRWFTSERENQTYWDLAGTATLLERHYEVLESLVAGMSTATAVYDLFGRVLSINNLMANLLISHKLQPYRATTFELIRFFTGRDDLHARHLMRHVILERGSISIPVKVSTQPDTQYLLRIYALPASRETPEGPEPFHVPGLVCEVVDTTPYSNLARLKGLIAERLGVQLRNDFGAIKMSASLLEASQVTDEQKEMLLQTIHDRLARADQIIADCQQYLEKDVTASGAECYPLDALALLAQVLQEATPVAADRHVKLDIAQPRLMNYVLASADNLGRLFRAVLSLLVKDAAEETTLNVTVETQPQWVTFHFSNTGFGIPDDRFHKILASAEPASLDEFNVLRQAVSWAHNWGGMLEVSSGVGSGYRIALSLRQFM